MNKPADNTKNAVVRQIIDYIRSEQLSTGDRLPSIRQLSEILQAGPNVVRDAILQAQTMGLLKVHPRSGAFVQSLDFSLLVDALGDTMETALMQKDINLFHLVDARRVIEMEVVAKAAQQHRPEDLLPLRQALEAMEANVEDRPRFIEADEQFHLAIAMMAGNPVLSVVVRSLLVLLRPYRMMIRPRSEDRSRTSRLHATIYQCIVTGAVEQAREAMSEHLTDHREQLLNQVETVPFSTGMPISIPDD
jgi:DNA-binding FadR family transcriptional regulator